MNTIEEKIRKLRKRISYHDYLYYNVSDPKITDIEYDQLISQLTKIESENPHLISSTSPTRRVGGSISHTVLRRVYYKCPMLSLDKSFDEEHFLKFHKRLCSILDLKTIEYCCELKFDGVAVSIFYKNGKILTASTRGDGKIGEDITSKIYEINDIPTNIAVKNIPNELEIRGELFLFWKNFQLLKKENEKFSNPRNTTSGLLRTKYSNAASKLISFRAHSLGWMIGENDNIRTQFECIEQFRSWNIPVSSTISICSSPESVLKFYNKIKKERVDLGFDVDGVVIKINSRSLQEKLGNNSRAPKWAIALKFSDQVYKTKIQRIKFQTGRTGIITPIAILEPKKISGIIIKQATLHNFKEIVRLKISIGSTVLVKRAGNVIPKIVKSVVPAEDSLTENTYPIVLPVFCLSCGSKIIFDKNIARCTNAFSCFSQTKNSIKHFVSREGMNINGLGNSVITQLIKNRYITTLDDLFKITREELIKLDNVNYCTADKILREILKSRKTTFSRFIYSLGIRTVGTATSKKLAAHFFSFKALSSASISDIREIPDIGIITARYITTFFSNKRNINIIQNLFSQGVMLKKSNLTLDSRSSFFLGKKIVFTGKLKSIGRSEIEELLLILGAKVSKYLSKNTDILVLGENPGEKLNKAKTLKILILQEKKVLDLIK